MVVRIFCFRNILNKKKSKMKRKEIKKKSKTNRKYDTGKYFHDVIILVVSE